MLNNTRETLRDIVADLKRFAFVCGVLTNTLPIIYLIYAICAPAGILWVNIALLFPSVLYFVFYLWIHYNEQLLTKKTKRLTKHAFKWYKLFVKLLNAVVVIYTIYASSTHVTVWSVVLAAFTAISLLFQMILELVVLYVERQCDRIYQSFRDDISMVMKPIDQVKGFIGKFRKESDDDTVKDGEYEVFDSYEEPKKRFLDRILRK